MDRPFMGHRQQPLLKLCSKRRELPIDFTDPLLLLLRKSGTCTNKAQMLLLKQFQRLLIKLELVAVLIERLDPPEQLAVQRNVVGVSGQPGGSEEHTSELQS